MINKIIISFFLFAHLSLFSVDHSLAAKLDAYIQAHTALGYFSGAVLIAQNDKIILCKGYGSSNYEHCVPNCSHTKFKLSSLTKPFISLAIMQLQEKGLLNVDDTLCKYIPDYPRASQITIHNLLSHTSGIQNYTSLPEFDQFKKHSHSLTKVIDIFKSLPLYFEPGCSYKFSNSNYVLLSYIIELITGISCAEYIIEQICKPIGMRNTCIDNFEKILVDRANGYTLTDGQLSNADYCDPSAIVGLGCLYSTVQDMYIFNQVLYTQKLATTQSLAQMFKPYTYIGDKIDNIQYGYGWATIEIDGHIAKKHLGDIDGFTSAMYRFIDDNIFIVMLSNFQHMLKEPFCFDLAHIIFDTPYHVPKKQNPIIIDNTHYKKIAGTYRYKSISFSITVKNNCLYLKQPDKPEYQLLPKSDTTFFTCGAPIEVEFIKDAQANVQSMITTAFGITRKLEKIK